MLEIHGSASVVRVLTIAPLYIHQEQVSISVRGNWNVGNTGNGPENPIQQVFLHGGADMSQESR